MTIFRAKREQNIKKERMPVKNKARIFLVIINFHVAYRATMIMGSADNFMQITKQVSRIRSMNLTEYWIIALL